MGTANNEQRDTSEFGQGRPEVREVIRRGFRYRDMSEDEKRESQDLIRALVEEARGNCPNPDDYIAFGWKRPTTIFTCELVLDAYPEGKTVHLVRDGRDVMLSRLDSRMKRLDDSLNSLMVFGEEDVTEYKGKPLVRSTIEDYRNEIEMTHWVTAVSFGMRGREYGDRYMEVRYEDLCTSPEETMQSVFDFLGVPFRDEVREWAKANASARSIGKWRGHEMELASAIKIGEPLLQKLGYC